jgi:hypothetical protein
MANILPQSQSQFVQVFYDSITSLNPNLVPSIPGGDFYFVGDATSQLAANIVQDIQLFYNNIFPASSNSTYLDKHAAALGMTPRMGALPSLGTVTLIATGTSSASYTILEGTLLQSSVTNNQYKTTQDVIIPTLTIVNTITLPIMSVLLGTGTESPAADILTFSTPFTVPTGILVSTATVTGNMIAGSDIESDQQFALRIFDFAQNPRGGGSDGDYISWCFLGSSNVTQATVIQTIIIGNNNILFPIILSGNSDSNYYVDGNISNGFAQTPAPINRTTPNLDIEKVQIYINGVKPENDNPFVLTVATYEFSNSMPSPRIVNTTLVGTYFNINVSLSPGLILATQLTLPDLPSPGYITVENLIKREFRRGILRAPLGGTSVTLNPAAANQFLIISDIENIMQQGLANNGNFQGNFASILIALQIEYFPGGLPNLTPDYIEVPSLDSSTLFKIIGSSWEAYLVYDVDYTILNVKDNSQP